MPDGPEYGPPDQIDPQSLADYLAVMSRAVFQSGMSWRTVNAKWPSIREAFGGFDPQAIAAFGEREIDELAQDTRVIRNRRKLQAISNNAARLLELDADHGSFRDYLRSHDDFDATVKDLKHQFSFLGDTGSYYFLYVVGEPVPPHEEWEATRQQR